MIAQNDLSAFKYISVGFSGFGYLIGYICGLTSSPVSNTLVIALFSFLGGKLFQDMYSFDGKKAKISGIILLLFSIFFFLGLNSGILVKVNQFLTIKQSLKSSKRLLQLEGQIDTNITYLRSDEFLNSLESKFRRNELTTQEKDSIISYFYSRVQK